MYTLCLGITAAMWSAVQSDGVEFGHNEDSYRLVEWRANTQTLFIRTPVKTGNGLCGESDVLQEIHRAGDAHVYIIRTRLSPLGWILTVTIHKQWSMQKGILTKKYYLKEITYYFHRCRLPAPPAVMKMSRFWGKCLTCHIVDLWAWNTESRC